MKKYLECFFNSRVASTLKEYSSLIYNPFYRKILKTMLSAINYAKNSFRLY